MRYYFLLFILFFFFQSCLKKKTNPTLYPDLTPFAINIEIMKDGFALPDSVMNKVRMSYYLSGKKQYITDLDFLKSPVDTTKSLIVSVQPYFFSSYTNRPSSIGYPNNVQVSVPTSIISNYLIEYPYGLKPDTLQLVTKINNAEEALKSLCVCVYPPPQVIQFNGVPAQLDTALTEKVGCINCYANIYLLKK